MEIAQLTDSGPLASLELTMRFAAQRQRLIAHNIANLGTPNFTQKDVSVEGFRRTLDRAVSERRERTGGMHGELGWRESRELRRGGRGRLELEPRTDGPGVLAHDRNNRSLVRVMQDLTEPTAAFRVASDLYRTHLGQVHMAIGERVG